jgi:DNA-binding HxlR family transcriptional regulator
VRSYGQYCAVAKALDVVGDRWTLLVIRELMLRGGARYTDIQEGLPGIATNLLTSRLRELEEQGIVWREAAPPPVATTLYHLTDAGRELDPILRALGRWGARFMADPPGPLAFRSHWLTFPVTEFLRDVRPDEPPVTIEVRPGDRPAVIEVGHGALVTRVGAADSPDLILEGSAPLILGLLTSRIGLDEARRSGLEATGDTGVLERLQFLDPALEETVG